MSDSDKKKSLKLVAKSLRNEIDCIDNEISFIETKRRLYFNRLKNLNESKLLIENRINETNNKINDLSNE